MSKAKKQIDKAIKMQAQKTKPSKRDTISNRKGLIEGVDSEYQWFNTRKGFGFERMESIGSRRKI